MNENGSELNIIATIQQIIFEVTDSLLSQLVAKSVDCHVGYIRSRESRVREETLRLTPVSHSHPGYHFSWLRSRLNSFE